MKSRNVLRASATGLLIAALAACSSSAPHVGESSSTTQVSEGVKVSSYDNRYLTADGKLGGEESAEVTAQANVVAIDPHSRMITLRFPDGEMKSIKAGSEVRNFNQIKVGDQVAIGYVVSVAFEAREPTADEVRRASEPVAVAARAKPGQKPAGLVAAEQIKIVTIASIDKQKQLVTFKDLAGAYTTVKAKYPENLSLVKPGDRVVLTLTEAIAARVTPMN